MRLDVVSVLGLMVFVCLFALFLVRELGQLVFNKCKFINLCIINTCLFFCQRSTFKCRVSCSVNLFLSKET